MTTPSSSLEKVSHENPYSSDHQSDQNNLTPNSWCSQTVIHQNCPTLLLDFFPSSKLFSDKNYLSDTFSLIKSHQHIFHSQWRSLIKAIPNLLDISFELLQRFEINGLQLNGLGCWFFLQVLSSSTSLSSNKYPSELIIELLLRILLEHPVSNDCISILAEILKSKQDTVMVICQIGIRIADELPQTISEENFVSLMSFLLKQLIKMKTSDRFSSTDSVGEQLQLFSVCFVMLTMISRRVTATSHVNYFLEFYCDQLISYYLRLIQTSGSQYLLLPTKPQSSLASASSPAEEEAKELIIDPHQPLEQKHLMIPQLTTGFNIVYNMLSSFLSLHHSHIHIFFKHSYHQIAIDLLKSNLIPMEQQRTATATAAIPNLGSAPEEEKVASSPAPVNYSILYSISLMKFLIEMSSVPDYLLFIRKQFSIQDFVTFFPFYSYLPSTAAAMAPMAPPLPIQFSDHILYFVNFFQLCYGNHLRLASSGGLSSGSGLAYQQPLPDVNAAYSDRYCGQFLQNLVLHPPLKDDLDFSDYEELFPFLELFLNYSSQLLSETYYNHDLETGQLLIHGGRIRSGSTQKRPSNPIRDMALGARPSSPSSSNPITPSDEIYCPLTYLFLTYRFIQSSSPILRNIILFHESFHLTTNKILVLLQRFLKKFQSGGSDYAAEYHLSKKTSSTKTIRPKSPLKGSFLMDGNLGSNFDESAFFSRDIEDLDPDLVNVEDEEDEEEEGEGEEGEDDEEQEDQSIGSRGGSDVEDAEVKAYEIYLFDVISFFSGWEDITWKWYPPVDSSVECLLLDQTSASPVTQPSRCLSSDQISITFQLDHLSNFIQDWETESIERVIQQILVLVGVSRYYPPLSSTNHLIFLPNLHLPQLIEIIIELLGDSRHGITTISIQEKCIQLLTDCLFYVNNYHHQDHPLPLLPRQRASQRHRAVHETYISPPIDPESVEVGGGIGLGTGTGLGFGFGEETYQLTVPINYDYLCQGIEYIFELLFNYAEIASTSSSSIEITTPPLNSLETNKYFLKSSVNSFDFIYLNFLHTSFHFILLILSLRNIHYTFKRNDENENDITITAATQQPRQGRDKGGGGGGTSGGINGNGNASSGSYQSHDITIHTNKYRKIFMTHFDRFNLLILQRNHSSFFDQNIFKIFSLELSKNIIPSIKRMTITQEMTLFTWIYEGLSSQSISLILSACQFFQLLLSSSLSYVITRVFSRYEVERLLIKLFHLAFEQLQLQSRQKSQQYQSLRKKGQGHGPGQGQVQGGGRDGQGNYGNQDLSLCVTIMNTLNLFMIYYNPTPFWVFHRYSDPIHFHYYQQHSLSAPPAPPAAPPLAAAGGAPAADATPSSVSSPPTPSSSPHRYLLSIPFLHSALSNFDKISSHASSHLILCHLLNMFSSNIQHNLSCLGGTDSQGQYILSYMRAFIPHLSQLLRTITKDYAFITSLPSYSSSLHHHSLQQDNSASLHDSTVSSTSPTRTRSRTATMDGMKATRETVEEEQEDSPSASPSKDNDKEKEDNKKEKKKIKRNKKDIFTSYLSGVMGGARENLYRQYVNPTHHTTLPKTDDQGQGQPQQAQPQQGQPQVSSQQVKKTPSFKKSNSLPISPKEFSKGASSLEGRGGGRGGGGGDEEFTLVVTPETALVSSSSIFLPLLSVELQSITPQNEFITSVTLQSLLIVITNISLFSPPPPPPPPHTPPTQPTQPSKYELLQTLELSFPSTPLTESLIFILLQYPHHHLIQLHGLQILNQFILQEYSLKILCCCVNKLLNNAMVNAVEENSKAIHSLFCTLLFNLIAVIDQTPNQRNQQGNGAATASAAASAAVATAEGTDSGAVGERGGEGKGKGKKRDDKERDGNGNGKSSVLSDEELSMKKMSTENEISRESQGIALTSGSSRSRDTSSLIPGVIPGSGGGREGCGGALEGRGGGGTGHHFKECIMKWGLYKWLYVILKSASHEIAYKACQLITLLAYNETNANLICDSGIVRIILLLLEKFSQVLRIQFEGLRSILALCRATNSTIKIIKILKGEKILKTTRKYLKHLIATSEEMKVKELFAKNQLSKEEIEEIYLESSVKKRIDQCFLS